MTLTVPLFPMAIFEAELKCLQFVQMLGFQEKLLEI